MRCDDLTRELAAPTGALDPAGRAAHLAACPACAARVARAEAFDRIWEATRPAEPPAEALDALWARASAALDAPAPATIRFEPPARRAWRTLAIVGAQAAALVAAALILFEPPTPPVEVAEAPAPTRVNVGIDETLIVRIGDGGHQVEVLDESASFGFPSMADSTPHDVFNALESMAAQ